MPKLYHGRVILIHGAEFRKKSRGNMRRLAPSFRAAGFCTIIPTYGFLPALLLGIFPWLDRRIAEALSGFIQPDDILVGHSNGATLSYLISKRMGAGVRGALLINAALESDKVPNAHFVHVYYNSGDIVTKISELLPFHIWGGMGGLGYEGLDSRVRNFDQSNTPGLPKLDGHSDVFSVGKCRAWARFMAESCLREVLALHRSQS
jgi:pimeloyl-ACP methyl ester carboxylesterase